VRTLSVTPILIFVGVGSTRRFNVHHLTTTYISPLCVEIIAYSVGHGGRGSRKRGSGTKTITHSCLFG